MTQLKFIRYIILYLVLLILGFVIGIVVTENKYKAKETNIEIDLNYNQNRVDSIYLNINKTDSLINNLKLKDTIRYEKIWSLTDSASLKLFYELSQGQ